MKAIAAIAAAVMVAAAVTGCAGSATEEVSGPTEITLDEEVVYTATVRNAPPVFGLVEFDWQLDVSPPDEPGSHVLHWHPTEMIPVDQTGVASGTFMFNNSDIEQWIKSHWDWDVDDLGDEMWVRVGATVYSTLETTPAQFGDRMRVTINK